MSQMRELRAAYREASGYIGPIEFVLHPDDFAGRVRQELLEMSATVTLDRECPPGKVYCRESVAIQ
jgi:hypothetical protein